MRRVLASLCASLLIVGLAAVPATAGGPSSDPFTGAWKATDFDHSAMNLTISGGGPTRHVVYFDLSCGACIPSGFPWVFVGTGQVAGSTLSVTGTWHAVNAELGGSGFGVGEINFTAVDGMLLSGEYPYEQPWYRYR
jgi:hypothetical protein